MQGFLGKLWQSAVILSMFFAVGVFAKVTIYMCGDSTMQDWRESAYPKQGIGQNFGYFFNANLVTVANRGAGGTAANTYYKNNWLGVANEIKAGDYVVIQFGINDRNYGKEDGISQDSVFKKYITKMVEESKAKNAIPILISPVRRSDFRPNDSIYESYHQYPWLVRELAERLNVPMIDMDTLSRNYLLSVGQYYALHYLNMVLDAGEYSNYTNGNSDNLHLQQNGAIAFGRITTEQMRVHANPQVKKLGDYMAKMYQVDVEVSPEGADSATTVSSYYPEGIQVTLKTTPKAGKKFLGWYDGNGNKVSGNSEKTVQSNLIYTFKMGKQSTKFTAVYEGGTPKKYTGNGAALTNFPTGTPKKLQGVQVDDPIIQTDTSEKIISKKMAKFFDAHKPDSGNGFSENNNAGFTSEGFWNFNNEKNSFASFTMKFPTAARVTMAVIYANGGKTNRDLNIYLDHDYNVEFKPTANWTTWDTVYFNLDLLHGENEIKMISLSDDGGPNIDAFGFSIEGVCRVGIDCEKKDTTKVDTTAVDSSKTAIHTLKNLRLQNQNAKVKVFDLNGKLISNFTTNSLANLENELRVNIKQNGLFHIMIQNGNVRKNFNFANVN